MSCLQKTGDKRVFSSDGPSFERLDTKSLVASREPVKNTTSVLSKTPQQINGEAQKYLQKDALLKNVIFLPSDVVS